MKKIEFFCLFWISMGGWGFAQQGTLPPRFDLVAIKGEQFPVFMMEETQWQACAFDHAYKSWRVVPFQVDDFTKDGQIDLEGDRRLGPADELVFLARDCGDRAPQSIWFPGANTGERIEVEVFNPLDLNQKAWLYFFSTDNPVPKGYFSYSPAEGVSGADTINTSFYRLGHNRRGWITYLSENLASGQNLIDRLKFHISGGGGVIPGISLTEDTLSLQTERFVSRPVRSYRVVKTHVALQIPPFPAIEKTDHFVITFSPFSMEIQAGFTIDSGTKNILVLTKIKHIRLSLDFNPQISDLRFFSPLNSQGVLIDGNPDGINPLLPKQPEKRWVMASGPPGSVIAFFKIPPITNIVGEYVYYRDNRAGGTNEGFADSGDGVSFGDMGFWLSGDALLPKENSLSVAMTLFFVPIENQQVSFGQDIVNALNNPLICRITAQSRPVSVPSEPDIPNDFEVLHVYPNPARLGTEIITIEIKPIQREPVLLTIFNLKGQQILRKNFINIGPGIRFLWSGLNSKGQAVPAGVYFLQVQSGRKTVCNKVLLFR